MAKGCQVCSHPKRAEIDGALLDGQSLNGVAKAYGSSRSALGRHRAKCLTETDMSSAELIARYNDLDADAIDLFDNASADGSWTAAGAALNGRRAIAGDIAKAMAASAHKLDSTPLSDRPEYQDFAAKLVETLDNFPEAKAAVLDLMAEEVGEPDHAA